MATPNTKELAIPIQIIGKNAHVSVSYKGMDTNGELHGQMTRSKNIENLPDDFVLYANYPNPFNPQTRIDFGLPDEGFISLKIYDIMGREVTTLVNDVLSPGYKSIMGTLQTSLDNLLVLGCISTHYRQKILFK